MGGRRITQARIEELLQKLEDGADLTAAAHAIGCKRDAIYKRMQRSKAFKERVEEAQAIADGDIVNALFKKAKAGDVQAIKYWLGNRRRGEWSNIDDPVHRATQPTRIEIHYDTEGEKSLQRHRRRLRLIRNDAAKKSSA